MSDSPPLSARSYNSVLDFKQTPPSTPLTTGGWIVQKFGGTSVGKFPENIVDDIVKVFSENNRVIVVCSARSSHTKSEGTTSRLLRTADLASSKGDFLSLLQVIEDDHVDNAKNKIESEEIRQKLIEDTKTELNHIKELLHACQVIGEISPRSLDTIMGVGEKLSCLFIAALMKDHGLNSVYMDLSDLIPLDYDFNNGFDDTFYKFLSSELGRRVAELEDDDAIPVMTGYFGVVPGGLLNGVGRGYTDLCAALAAVGVQADELQIWKEVDGIFTADPRKVPNARRLDSVTPEEAAELTYYGSEVIHPFTMEQVIKAKIPIRIKNVENPTGKGTIIFPDNIGRRGEATPPHPPAAYETLPSSYISSHKKRSATAITAKQNIVVINIHSNKKTLAHGFLAKIFTTLDKHKLVVDLISTSEVHVSMALSIQAEQELQLKHSLQELKTMGTVDITREMTIVSLVGKQMVNFIGIAGNMFKILADEKINIEMISQGANEINISAVINEKDTIRALQSIHAKLLEDNYEDTAASAIDLRLQFLKTQQ
ncbi:aspartate kinase (L-aspartate 4-P transferase) [Spathaspora passalidarum NRRL Y-27907]|uniref:Aspartokinase n=1 Tax=Spathaspora passalidarum (strain NRRL Y-27907 / 11-Y1) TaxID=619300 RepID=G3AEC9_SPAPN|nr:aspartate kinase (L-aspartate 4-P transferase) [Spathaspora passalidarum NRRL Y-27907]EGW35717.1 aspartate kinase (L-aspartate 4-P transferase) [Spathaspora passalidarum NRRL Y-27907]